MDADPISNIQAGGDVTGGDKISVGNVTDSYAAIGKGAQVIVNQIQAAHSAIDELEKGIQVAERRLAEEIQKKVLRYTRLAAGGTESGPRNPYKALLDYKLEDAPFFYGREEATAVMLEKIQRNALTILHADSGSGKTSLLQAGIASRLLTQGHLPLYLRPYRQPPGHFIKRSLLPDFDTVEDLQRFRDDQMSLRGFLDRVTNTMGGRRLYLLLDQFEEFFTEISPDARRDFAEQLQECIESDLEVRWVLSLRKEFFSDLRQFQPLKPFENEYFLPTFNLEEATEVIIEPAARQNVSYEAGLVDEILADIRQHALEIPPAQVQLVCYTLFEELDADVYPAVISRAGGATRGQKAFWPAICRAYCMTKCRDPNVSWPAGCWNPW